MKFLRLSARFRGKAARRLAVPCTMIALGFGLAGCMTMSEVDTDQLSDALNVASSAVNLAGAVSSVNAARSANTMRSTPALNTAANSARVPQPTGTTQRQSFEDCAAMYRAAGMNDLAAKCATRATNMNSLR